MEKKDCLDTLLKLTEILVNIATLISLLLQFLK